MFLQSQKKKSNIKYKTSEKPRKKKTKSKIKPKDQNAPQPEAAKQTAEPPKPVEPIEPPTPSNIKPKITEPTIPIPEPPVEVFSEPKPSQESYDYSNNVKSDLRFKNRNNAKFGIEEEESEGPELFLNSKANISKPANFTSLGENQMGKDKGKGKHDRDTFGSNGLFSDYDSKKRVSNKDNRTSSKNLRGQPQSLKNKNGKKKKKIINIFDEPKESNIQEPKTTQSKKKFQNKLIPR